MLKLKPDSLLPLTLPSFSSIYPPPPHFTLLFCCSWFPLSHFPLLLYFLLLLISPSFSFSLPPKIFLILVFPDVLKVFYLSHIWSDFSIVFTLPFLLLNGKWEANYVCLRMYLVTLVWATTWDDGSTSDDLRRHYRGQGDPPCALHCILQYNCCVIYSLLLYCTAL